MCRHIKIGILVITVVLLSTGCWDSLEIERKDITTAVVVDTAEEGYAFFLEIASLAGGGSGEQAQGLPTSRIIKSTGPSFVEARKNLERQSDKPIYLASVQCVVFTERLAYDSIEEYMYRFRQIPDYRKTSMIAITGEEPDDLFAAVSEGNALVGLAISDTIESLVDEGLLYHSTMGNVLASLSCPCRSYLIPRIGLKNSDIAVDGFCVMDGGVCLGFIPIEEGAFISYILTKMPPFCYSMPFDEHNISVKINLKKKPVRVSYIDGQIRFDLSYSCIGKLLYMSTDMSVDDAMLKEIGEELEKTLIDELEKVIVTSQKVFQLDYLKLHEAFRIRYPDEAKEMTWKEQYPNAQITVDVSVKMQESNIDYEVEEYEEETNE